MRDGITETLSSWEDVRDWLKHIDQRMTLKLDDGLGAAVETNEML